MKIILVTGAAGFICSRISEMLLEDGYKIVGIDNLNDYYDTGLKLWRLNNLKNNVNFRFYQTDIENYNGLNSIFQERTPEAVINLAARAGLRYSLENPFTYLSTDARGTLNLLELCKEYSAEAMAYTYHYLYGIDVTILRYFTVYRPGGRPDIDKPRKLLDWQPQVSLEEGIKRTVEWTKDNWEWVKNIKIN